MLDIYQRLYVSKCQTTQIFLKTNLVKLAGKVHSGQNSYNNGVADNVVYLIKMIHLSFLGSSTLCYGHNWPEIWLYGCIA